MKHPFNITLISYTSVPSSQEFDQDSAGSVTNAALMLVVAPLQSKVYFMDVLWREVQSALSIGPFCKLAVLLL